MKRRSWIWFIASAILAVLAGILAIYALNIFSQEEPGPAPTQQLVVVASQPIAADTLIRADLVSLEARDEVVSGAATTAADVLGKRALREFAPGEQILMQDIVDITEVISGVNPIPYQLDEDTIAVALPANDILSKWGAVLIGDRVDVLFTTDAILETPMYPQDLVDRGQQITVLERDQTMDNVSVLALQNLQVLQIIEEPTQEPVEEGETPPPRNRALVLKIDPQDAVVLKYLRDSLSVLDLALRNPENETLFSVEPVNINYLVLRYGISLPQPLE
jgi:Flp pilus assembly protein CpaB